MRFVAVSAVLLLAACGGGGDADAGVDGGIDAFVPDISFEDRPSPDSAVDLADLGPDMPDLGPRDMGFDAGPECGALRRVHVLPAGVLASPTVATAPPGDDRIFVVDRLSGTVRIIDASGALTTAPFLDVSGSIDTSGYEAGLVALAFDPGWPATLQVYASYTTASTLRVVRFDVASATDDVVVAGSESLILEVPTFDHHDVSGWLAFGPGGLLYIGMGDNSSDALGQNKNTLLSKLLRIDVHASGVPYAVPPTNPFVGMAPAREEIFAYGLRMPYRFSFDPSTSDLYIGEVGDATWEELDVIPAGDPGGENYGWAVAEGPGCRMPPVGCSMTGFTSPDFSYSHMGSHAAIVGGDVYRGSAMPACWQGRWFYADYELGFVGSLRWSAGAVTGEERYDDLASGFIVSMGEDGHGELLVLGADGAIDRLASP